MLQSYFLDLDNYLETHQLMDWTLVQPSRSEDVGQITIHVLRAFQIVTKLLLMEMMKFLNHSSKRRKHSQGQFKESAKEREMLTENLVSFLNEPEKSYRRISLS